MTIFLSKFFTITSFNNVIVRLFVTPLWLQNYLKVVYQVFYFFKKMDLVSIRSQYDKEDIPTFINIDGNIKKNKWRIPASLNNEEQKFLIAAKKKAYMLDEKCCWCCCIGLDPLIGKLYCIYQI